jgi:hypothetical protein
LGDGDVANSRLRRRENVKVKSGRILGSARLVLKIGTGNTGYWRH